MPLPHGELGHAAALSDFFQLHSFIIVQINDLIVGLVQYFPQPFPQRLVVKLLRQRAQNAAISRSSSRKTFAARYPSATA